MNQCIGSNDGRNLSGSIKGDVFDFEKTFLGNKLGLEHKDNSVSDGLKTPSKELQKTSTVVALNDTEKTPKVASSELLPHSQPENILLKVFEGCDIDFENTYNKGAPEKDVPMVDSLLKQWNTKLLQENHPPPTPGLPGSCSKISPSFVKHHPVAIHPTGNNDDVVVFSKEMKDQLQNKDNKKSGSDTTSTSTKSLDTRSLQKQEDKIQTKQKDCLVRRSATTAPRLFGGRSYHLRSKWRTFLQTAENKRRNWIEAQLEATRKEFQYYASILDQSLYETSRLASFMQNSYKAFSEYSDMLEPIFNDSLVSSSGKLLDSKGRSTRQIIKQDVLNAAYSSPLLSPIFEAVDNLKGSIDEHLNAIEKILKEVVSLQQDMTSHANVLKEKGNNLLSEYIQQTEPLVRLAFDDIITVLDWHKYGNRTGMVKPDCEDQWLSEVRYRSSVRTAHTAWKTNRSELETVFENILIFEEARRSRLTDILPRFLYHQRALVKSAASSILPASLSLRRDFFDVEANKELEQIAVEEILEKLIQSKTAETPAHQLDGEDSETDFHSFLDTDLSTSGFVKNEAMFETFVDCTWKLSLGMVTSDSRLQIFFLKPNIGTMNNVDNAHMQVLESPTPDLIFSLEDYEILLDSDDEYAGKDTSRQLTLLQIPDSGMNIRNSKMADGYLNLRFSTAEECMDWIHSSKQESNFDD